MVITHAAVKVRGETGTHQEWNAEHVFDDENRALRGSSFIVAASDSRDKARADYVCDGTADEVEINTAINDLPAGGGGIQLLEGTYTLSSRIVISKNNVSIVGMGKATQIRPILTYAELYLIYADTKECLLFKDFFMNGRDLVLFGIFLDGTTESSIINCWFEMCRVGVYLFEDANNNNVFNNHFSDNTSSGITIEVSHNNNIVGNNLLNHDVNAIRIAGMPTSSTHNSIIGNQSSNNLRYGIILDTNSFFNIVKGNECNDNARDGINLYRGGRNIIVGNQCNDNGSSGAFDGIVVIGDPGADRGDENIIADNICFGNTQNGINISDANCDRNLVHGNICLTNTVGQINDAGTNTVLADNIVA